MKITLRTLGFMGMVLFGLLFAFTYSIPDAMESSAKSFVKIQIEKEIQQKFRDSEKAQSVKEKALLLANKFGMDEEQFKHYLKIKLPEKISSIVASMCGYDCEKEKELTLSITKGYLKKIASLKIAQQTLGDIIKSKYLEIVGKLKVDLRIFFGTNCAVFAILLLVSFFKPQAIAHLFLPGVLLFISTATSSGIYILGQNWFYTIIYNDYLGFGYLAYLFVIFAFLMDIAFNGGRVTLEILNSFFEAIGSAFSLSPC